MSHADQIARIRIQLDDWQPSVWRRVEVPLTATLKALHDIIQAAMLFDDCHLFEFRADGRRYAIPDPEWESPGDRTRSVKSTRLGALVDRGITELAYTYDFGDDWRHTLTIELVAQADPSAEYPRFIDGERHAPPEDVGGIPGFDLFLAAIANPEHEQYLELVRWYGQPFDPEDIDEGQIRKRMEILSRRRTLGKAGFAKNRSRVH